MAKKPEPKLDVPVEFDLARVLLYREIGRYAFALLDDATIEELVIAVASGRKLSFLKRRDALDREREALKTINRKGEMTADHSEAIQLATRLLELRREFENIKGIEPKIYQRLENHCVVHGPRIARALLDLT